MGRGGVFWESFGAGEDEERYVFCGGEGECVKYRRALWWQIEVFERLVMGME